MNALLSPLKELADYEEIIKNRNKESGTIQITGCVNSQKTHLMYALSRGVKYSLVVFSNDEKRNRRMKNINFLMKTHIIIRLVICYFIMQISRENICRASEWKLSGQYWNVTRVHQLL